ncbi:polyamine oxidase [Aspergillus udagawae]|uniref:Polyamine oxidase n=1 Tax=Aspergillus udagawae TaxID=91492 RepID=A0A8H3SCU5_9EURO|nr:polyamine oxidase [Aspergillus udagawae]
MATPFNFSSKFLSELPANTPELVASNIKTSNSHCAANWTKPLISMSSASLPCPQMLSPNLSLTRRRRSQAPTHVLQRRRTQTDHQPAQAPTRDCNRLLYRLYWDRMLKMGLRRELIPTGSATVEDGPYAKEPNASYVAGQTLRLRRKWPNYVTKTAFEDMLGRLRLHKEWWFGHGRTGAMGVDC